MREHFTSSLVVEGKEEGEKERLPFADRRLSFPSSSSFFRLQSLRPRSRARNAEETMGYSTQPSRGAWTYFLGKIGTEPSFSSTRVSEVLLLLLLPFNAHPHPFRLLLLASVYAKIHKSNLNCPF